MCFYDIFIIGDRTRRDNNLRRASGLSLCPEGVPFHCSAFLLSVWGKVAPSLLSNEEMDLPETWAQTLPHRVMATWPPLLWIWEPGGVLAFEATPLPHP